MGISVLLNDGQRRSTVAVMHANETQNPRASIDTNAEVGGQNVQRCVVVVGVAAWGQVNESADSFSRGENDEVCQR